MSTSLEHYLKKVEGFMTLFQGYITLYKSGRQVPKSHSIDKCLN